MSIDGHWADMGKLITDEMLDSFAVVGTYDQIASKIKTTYGDFAESVTFSITGDVSPQMENTLREIIADLQSGGKVAS